MKRHTRRAIFTAIAAAGAVVAGSLVSSPALGVASTDIWPDDGPYIGSSVIGPESWSDKGPGLVGYEVVTVWSTTGVNASGGCTGTRVVDFVDGSGAKLADVVGSGLAWLDYADLRFFTVQAPQSLADPLEGILRIRCEYGDGTPTKSIANLPLTISPDPQPLYRDMNQWTINDFRGGASATFHAVGFLPGEQVRIALVNLGASVPTAWSTATVTADGAGAISGSLEVPAGYEGTNDRISVAATGQTSRHALPAELPISALSSRSICFDAEAVSNDASPSGFSLAISLSEFNANANVKVVLHSASEPIPVGTVVLGPDGTARTSLDVPDGPSGDYVAWVGETTEGYLLDSDPVDIALPADVTRLAGANRFATSAAISAETFLGCGVPVAYIANGRGFADALSGAPAAAIDGGPVLLAEAGSIPSDVAAELARLQPKRIVVLGGTAVISDKVRSALEEYSEEAVTRLAGANRFETSAAISAATFPKPGVPVAYIANGRGFPDALSGAPAAAIQGGPVLLAEAGSIPSVVAAELSRLKPERIVVLGGTAVISDTVAAALEAFTDGPVTRLAGASRFETSAAISAATFPKPGVPVAYIANGRGFPDALSGAPAAGLQGGPVLLTEAGRIPSDIAAELSRLKPERIVVLGGTAVISDAVSTELEGYATG